MLVRPLMTNVKMTVRDDCTVSACTPHPTLSTKVLTPCLSRASLVAQRVRHLPAMQETWVQSLGREDPLEKEMATHSSITAWRIPWMEESGGLQSTGSQRIDFIFFLSFLFVKGEVSLWTDIHHPPPRPPPPFLSVASI